MYCIKVVFGPDEGKLIDLIPNVPCIVGREEAIANFVLTDPEVSRQHAKLYLDQNGIITVTDLDSLNGTIYKNNYITSTQKIECNEIIIVGDTHLQIQQSKEYVASGSADEYDQIFYLDKTFRIGRDPRNDIVLDHPHVSRFHARVELKDEECHIFDLNSANGTYVDGKKVEKYQILLDGSLIQISEYQFIVNWNVDEWFDWADVFDSLWDALIED